MKHILDNPIWNALNTGNAPISRGDNHAKYFEREIGFFAGLKDRSEQNFNHLYKLLANNEIAVLFSPEEMKIPAGWKVYEHKKLLQMVFENQPIPSVPENNIVALDKRNNSEMLALTAKTTPGPFLSRTIELGNYEGIYEEGRLVAMAGQRFKPGMYTEISAVCTDPDYAGRGYASMLIRSQIRKITTEDRTPFLHVLPENEGALRLYGKLGFAIRKEFIVYVIGKDAAKIS